MSDTAFHWLMFVLGVLTFSGTIAVQLRASSRMEGITTERLDNHDDKIKTIEVEQVRQWETLGRHGEQISALKTKAGLHF